MTDALILDGVSKCFGPVKAVQDVSFRVGRGSICGFIGPNGAGKTTTIRMVMSIIYPDTGTITVLGERDGEAIKDRLGYLPEEKGLYKKMKAGEIGKRLGLSDQLVRNVLHAFNEQGIACLKPGTKARKDDQRAFDDQARERLREIIRQSPRSYGYETSLWTLDLLAEVSYKEGLTARLVHKDTMSQTLHEMGANWKRVKHWITSPDEHYERKKSAEIG